MLVFSIALASMISGYDAYVNACSTKAENRAVCECQANFLALSLDDDEILALTVAGSNAMGGRTDRLKELAEKNPKAVVALKKLESQAIACEGY